MTSTDKTKLDGVDTGAQVNQFAWNTIAISGQPDVIAEVDSDTLTLIAGTGIALTTAPVGDAITITATGGGGGGSSPLTTKGDLYTYDTADARLPASITNGQVLTIDTAEATGMKWAAAGAASFGHEWVVLQFQNTDNFDASATTTSANVTVTHDGTSANVTGFDFTGYTRPPISINIYSQNITNRQWTMVDTSALVETRIAISDANGGTETPDMIDFGTPFIGQITMGLPKTDTNAVNGGLPVKYAKLLVNFTFSG